MSKFTFKNTKGEVFEINGPDGLTQAQANEIYKKQSDTGSLVGFKPGDTLSAATQAADGLASAQATLAQAQASVPGLGSLSAASAALAGAGGAISGSLAKAQAGLTAIVGPAVSAISGAIGSIGKAGSPLVGSGVVQGSVAVTSIQTINKAITSLPVTAPINTADFTKVAAGLTTGSAAAPIGPMSVPEVNGVLAQAKNLVGQASNALSNSKGLGSFGLSIGQLETAGYVKPGTKALLSAGANLFSDVVKSPSIWTGKDGIKSSADLLKNAPKQSLIQQDLMAKGVAGLAAVGVPVKNLSSQGIAGMSLNAAKDLPGAEAFAKGLPIPGDATGAVQAAFGSAVRDAAFAVNLVNAKIATVFKQQDTPVPAADTVNRDTINAASSRVLGDPKIPAPNYGGTTKTENEADVENYVSKSVILVNQYINVAGRAFEAISIKITALENQQTITQQDYDSIQAEVTSAKDAYNATAPGLYAEIIGILGRLTPAQQRVVDTFSNSPTKISSTVTYLLDQVKQIRERIKQLSFKIEGRGEGE